MTIKRYLILALLITAYTNFYTLSMKQEMEQETVDNMLDQQTIVLKNVNAKDIERLFKEEPKSKLVKLAPNNKIQILIDKKSNTITLIGNPKDINNIRRLIEEYIDVQTDIDFSPLLAYPKPINKYY